MKHHVFKGNRYSILFFQLTIALILLSLSRMGLYFFNVNYFSNLSFQDLILIFIYGLRFDLSSLMMLYSPFILLSIFPFYFDRKSQIKKILLYITLILVSLAIIANLIDVIYFRFTLKRSTYDLFRFLDANIGIFDLLKTMLVDFWFMIPIAAILLFPLFYFSTHVSEKEISQKQNPKQLITHILLYVFLIGLVILGMRGGTQLKPLNIIDAAKMVPSDQIPLVLNTPFSIIVTRGQEHLVKKDWLDSKEALRDFNPVHQYNSDSSIPQKKNIVILILESFSANRIGYFQPDTSKKTLTPFLDSLLAHSLTFKGIANGKKSIEGIPAILSGIPSLMEQPFLTSVYATNQFSGISSVLKGEGYSTAFFHGGKNGTMNFDSYASKTNFDFYFGMNEYPNQEDYDGNWGIWDHDFYPFFNSKLNEFKEPFMAAFFSLSSHHPYAIPKEFQSKFGGKESFNGSLAYSDYALSKFFEQAKKEDWFQNTLFILTADHSAELPGTRDSSNLIHFEIPIAFYAPNDSTLIQKTHRKMIQQSDIFPSIMDYLGFHDSFVAFGNSVFDTLAPDFALYYLNQIYHGVSPDFIFEFNGEEFSFKNKVQTYSPILTQKQAVLEKQTKALIQNYADFMINNKLVPDKP